MSFNLRYPNRADGKDYWPLRKELAASTIAAFDPDVLGVQEATLAQVQYLETELDGYGRVGVGRDDGKDKGEMTAIYFRSARFELVAHGHFWLSEKPETIGSVGWDAAITRMATWLLLRDKNTNKQIIALNTHFDHRGSQARIESARLIRRRTARLLNAFDAEAIVMGDFNAAAPGSEPYDALMLGDGPTLIDTYLSVHADSDKPSGTFNAFRGKGDGARIDWIIVSTGLGIIDADIDRTNDNGRYPSDHYPVTAVLRVAE